jgi:hypothetical protein
MIEEEKRFAQLRQRVEAFRPGLHYYREGPEGEEPDYVVVLWPYGSSAEFAYTGTLDEIEEWLTGPSDEDVKRVLGEKWRLLSPGEVEEHCAGRRRPRLVWDAEDPTNSPDNAGPAPGAA